jgi:hypothetical protein
MNMTSMAYSRPRLEVRAFVIAWACALVFDFLEYAVRSAPAVMIPQLAASFRQTTFGVSSILGSYYYTYSTASPLAGSHMLRETGSRTRLSSVANSLARSNSNKHEIDR